MAQALGRLMAAGGEPIVALAGRTRQRAEHAARFITGPAAPGGPGGPGGTVRAVRAVAVAELPNLATRILIAVSDQAVETVAEALASAGMQSGAVLHTCGAKGPEALKALQMKGVACGMLHPLQTVMTAEQGVTSLADATFGLSGDWDATLWADEIVQIVTGAHDRSLHIEAGRTACYHGGAVMASNALMAVLDAAVSLMGHAGVGRDEALRAIGPLARTSLENALANGPQAALTGPVARGDAATVAAHRDAMRHVEPTVARLYDASARHLLQLARRRGLSDESVRAVEQALEKSSGSSRTVGKAE